MTKLITTRQPAASEIGRSASRVICQPTRATARRRRRRGAAPVVAVEAGKLFARPARVCPRTGQELDLLSGRRRDGAAARSASSAGARRASRACPCGGGGRAISRCFMSAAAATADYICCLAPPRHSNKPDQQLCGLLSLCTRAGERAAITFARRPSAACQPNSYLPDQMARAV